MSDFSKRAVNFFNLKVRPGPRTVIWTAQQGLGFGNYLYLWLDAFTESERGRDRKVLYAPTMLPWLERMPSLEHLSVRRENVRSADRREWNVNPRLFQRFGSDFVPDELDAFVRAHIAPAIGSRALEDRLVINVRRGDYYSDPVLRAAYGMDIVSYLEEAVRCVPTPSDVLVVSDDENWCRTNLSGLFRDADVNVGYASNDPWQNFKAVSTAKYLIGTNSSFSYWGGYVSMVMDATALVVMPGFHKRTVHGGWADQLDRRWQIVETLPNGWEE